MQSSEADEGAGGFNFHHLELFGREQMAKVAQVGDADVVDAKHEDGPSVTWYF